MRFHSLKDIENKVPKKGSFKHVLMQVEAAGVGIVTKQNTGKISDPRSNDEVAKGAMGDARRKYDNEHGYGSFMKLSAKEQNQLTHQEIVTRFRDRGRKVPKYTSTHTSTIGNKTDKDTSTFGEAAGVGKITKQNTTADVKPGETKRQAAKFGNKVDKDGRPPTLSKKVKGSKTNVLFNLGMAESVDNSDENMLYYAKMAETLGELASTSKVYVDMDGVLADFFGEWQKLIGKDWRNVKDIEPALQKIRDTDNFWLDLPLLPQAKNLLGIIKKVKGSYTILSSPLPNDPNSEPHKREWIKKNLDFFPPENVIITKDKAKFATNPDGTPNILIDDFGQNIASWEAAGGEGFKHKDHKFERTAKAIQKQFKEPVKEKAVSKKQQQFFGIVRAMQKGDMPKGGEAGEVAKDMKKSDVKKFASTKHKGLPKKKKSESYTRDQLPQIRKKHLKYIPHKIVSIKVESIVPVQKERLKENYTKQLKKIAGGKYTPIVVDSTNRIINGHHRYDVVKMLQMESITVAKLPYTLEFVLGMMKENFADGKKNESITEKTQSPEQWQKAMIKKYGEDGWYDIADAVRDYYESNAILNNTISDIIKIKKDHPSFTDYSGITKLYRYEKKDKNSAPTDDTFIPFAYNIKGAKNFVQSMAQGNMGFKKSDFELVEKDFNPGDAILNFTNLIELVHNAEDDDGEWYKREYEVWMKRTPYYTGTQTNENFADGKKKGKSRPGRVKKSGASCNGSVTSLRSKAKKASGERAKMYHWCANMKSGRKKSESLYTEKEFIEILTESTPQQLDEGIKDLLTKLPKNVLGKVTPLLKKIPKTAKNLTLIAVLLGTMVNAVAAGDMQKVDTPLDKLNNMATMSATMDTGNDIGPGQMAPKNIDVIKMPTPPPAPGADTPDGTNDNGVSTQTDKNGNRTVSSGAGTYTFSGDGNLLKYETPKIKGLQQTHDIAKKTVTVDFTGQSGDANIDQKATYDMNGKLISGDRIGISSGGAALSIDKDKGTTIDYQLSDKYKISANNKTGLSVNK